MPLHGEPSPAPADRYSSEPTRPRTGMDTDAGRVPLARTPEEQAEEEAFLSLYGAWAPLEPQAFAREMEGFDRPWWVVGGWAIEAATGYRREHEDTDVSLLACDVPAFVEFMTGRWHVWNNVGGVLHPLGDRWPTVDEPRSQLWLRANATSPWVADDGIRHLRPEIVLAHKAPLQRDKDEPDFEATLPLLTEERRTWLRSALESIVPDHHWLRRL
jgi:hypothetical protein